MKWLLVGLVLAVIGAQLFGGDSVKFVDIGKSLSQGVKPQVEAASFDGGGEWINSEPIVLAELLARPQTKAVLVDFWTYSCINCQRTMPYIRSWWDKYKDRGLVVVGVHTPEFEFEKEKENVVEAAQKYGVTWPVVQDNDYEIWKAYQNNYWPRKFLVDKTGKVVYDHIGEGGYEETEREIQKLLGLGGEEVTQESDSAGSVLRRQTPELYVNERGKVSGHFGQGKNKVELRGEWKVEEDYAVAGKDASLELEFQAASMNLVMSLPGDESGTVRVRVDGEEVKEIKVDRDDLYKLWDGQFGEHELVMEVEPGVRAHAFTFGS